MADSNPLRLVILGCGNISQGYAKTLVNHPGTLKLLGACDVDASRAEALTKQYGGKVYRSLDDVLADPNVEAVCNLTIAPVHFETNTRILTAGKHLHTEKPLAIDPADAQALVRLAREKDVQFSSAPTTFLGEACQTGGKVVRSGRLGKVRAIYGDMNWGRLEDWHPSPGSFYDVGSMYDVGVYPLSIVGSMFGPVNRVQGIGKIVHPERTLKDGSKLRIKTPDFMVAIVEYASGPIMRLTTNQYFSYHAKQRGVEIQGDDGSLHITNTLEFAAPVEYHKFGTETWAAEPPVREGFKGVEWARGLTELHDAIRTNRPPRSAASFAAHLVEVIAGIHKSINAGGRAMDITSTFEIPEPMDWAR